MARQHRIRFSMATALTAVSVLPMVLGAQIVRVPNPDAPRMLVATFKTTDKKLAGQTAEAVISRLSADIPFRALWVLPRADVVKALEGAGYPSDEALAPTDVNALAKQFRADEYIEGTVTKTATGFKLEARLVLMRDAELVQPLAVAEGEKLDRAAAALSRDLQEARKQLAAEKSCTQAGREQKWDAAVLAAKGGVTLYPRATLTRICELNAYVRAGKPSEAILATVDEILKIDPRSKKALVAAADAYGKTGNIDKKVEVLTELLASDPTNARLQEQIVYELTQSGKADKALPIISKAVEENPSDIGLVKAFWLVLGASKDYKRAVKVGEEMVSMDTSLADLQFFKKLASTYALDSNFAKGAEAAAKGTAKFPKDAELWTIRGQLEKNSGQTGPAIESFKKAIEIDTKNSSSPLQLALMLADANQMEEAFKYARAAQVAGGDPTQVAQVVNSLSNKTFRAAQASKSIDDYKKVFPMAYYADSIAKDDGAKSTSHFFIGASSIQIALAALSDADAKKSCDAAKIAQEYLGIAGVSLPRGGRAQPDLVGKMMPALGQLAPAIEQRTKAFCK
ncbi:MAG: hypothetical protein K2X99_00075 [Gemmatimonadaceae bacterium]|nr:hypothetical protein [Gemmatimonadaceae bacterium]